MVSGEIVRGSFIVQEAKFKNFCMRVWVGFDSLGGGFHSVKDVRLEMRGPLRHIEGSGDTKAQTS